MEDALESQHLAAQNFATQDASMQTILNAAKTAQGREADGLFSGGTNNPSLLP